MAVLGTAKAPVQIHGSNFQGGRAKPVHCQSEFLSGKEKCADVEVSTIAAGVTAEDVSLFDRYEHETEYSMIHLVIGANSKLEKVLYDAWERFGDKGNIASLEMTIAPGSHIINLKGRSSETKAQMIFNAPGRVLDFEYRECLTDKKKIEIYEASDLLKECSKK